MSSGHDLHSPTPLRLASRVREARATPLCFLTLAMVAMNDDGRRARGELM